MYEYVLALKGASFEEVFCHEPLGLCKFAHNDYVLEIRTKNRYDGNIIFDFPSCFVPMLGEESLLLTLYPISRYITLPALSISIDGSEDDEGFIRQLGEANEAERLLLHAYLLQQGYSHSQLYRAKLGIQAAKRII